VAVAFIAHCGVAGNLLSAWVLATRRLDLQPFLCRLLIALVAFDTVFLVADFLTYSLPMLSLTYADWLYPVISLLKPNGTVITKTK